ncbi:MAG: hypothetical protein JWN14_4472 [Chthonomonadales bacterium]|nr:hypothetical protein [Chthonomonadales bacterium]
MICLDTAALVTPLLPPPHRPDLRRRPRQDAGRRPFIPCERCRGRGTLQPATEGADKPICDDCSGSGRAR